MKPVSTVLLTGAGRGIGRAVALDLASKTNLTLLLVSKTSTCERTASECNALRADSARAFVWDVNDAGPARTKVIDAMVSAVGPIGLVHAAGILGPTGPFVDNDMDAWWNAFTVNVGATVRLVHGVLARMHKDAAGRIVLFAGGGAAYGYPNFSSYGTAKAALVRFTETLAMELGDEGPTITIIAPGANETDMLQEVRRAGGSIKTTAAIEEPCRLVRRLLLEDARCLHGRFVHVRDDWSSESSWSADHFKLRRIDS